MDTNLQIVQRLLELSKNQLEYSAFPKPFKEEYIFLANVLNSASDIYDREFKEEFRKAVGDYKSTLASEKQGFGWFHYPETLIWKYSQVRQIQWAIYGDSSYKDIVFRKELGNLAYKDLIEQIDRTVLMSPEELKQHEEEWMRLSQQIVDEMLREIEAEKQA